MQITIDELSYTVDVTPSRNSGPPGPWIEVMRREQQDEHDHWYGPTGHIHAEVLIDPRVQEVASRVFVELYEEWKRNSPPK